MDAGRAGRGPIAVIPLVSLLAVLACAPPVTVLGEDDTSTVATVGTTVGTTTTPSTTTGSEDTETGDVCDADLGCVVNKIDVLFVIDNSGTMGEEQRNLAANFPALIDALAMLEDGAGNPVGADVNIMVTTTDFGNPSCDAFEPAGYAPARGAPIHDPCTARIERFTGLGQNPIVVQEACTDRCDPQEPVFPRDHFIHFRGTEDNVDGGTAAEALACIGPQGIDGCGFESPLEAMVQALRADACWNDPNQPGCEAEGYTKPFLRDDAVLAIAIITDEADCSVKDYAIMDGPRFWEDLPGGGPPAESSALCWNAGVVCDGPDGSGVYSGCVAANKSVDGSAGVSDDEAVLHPLSRYTDHLLSLRQAGRDVIMLGILGVPEVTAHADTPPYQPTAGGVMELQYRSWRDPEFPSGDILPDEWAAGVTAADKAFEFGIGPGCTGYVDADDTYTGQAIPPVRVREVCERLDEPDDPLTPDDESKVRCCIESICGTDFTPALRCLTGLIQEAIVPEG